ncbi:hypothetical protein [Massilia sp. PWRC2]|uniref:hypothetical protein n=1 Tax=Massilia sp. PWRC2 TaxID=2804626 RepID=UPI003CEE78FB
MRLSKEIIALLRALDEAGSTLATAASAPPGQQSTQQSTQQSAQPFTQQSAQQATALARQVFDLQLVIRLGSGTVQLTKTGARALFQADCIAALEQTRAGGQPAMVADVERWLTSSGFFNATNKTITARGQLWLASLTPSAADQNACEGSRNAA